MLPHEDEKLGGEKENGCKVTDCDLVAKPPADITLADCVCVIVAAFPVTLILFM